MSKFDCKIFMESVRSHCGEAQVKPCLRQALLDCLRHNGEQFVLRAYPLILNRAADPVGLADYAPRAGNVRGKILALCSLALCPESLASHKATRPLLCLRNLKRNK